MITSKSLPQEQLTLAVTQGSQAMCAQSNYAFNLRVIVRTHSYLAANRVTAKGVTQVVSRSGLFMYTDRLLPARMRCSMLLEWPVLLDGRLPMQVSFSKARVEGCTALGNEGSYLVHVSFEQSGMEFRIRAKNSPLHSIPPPAAFCYQPQLTLQ